MNHCKFTATKDTGFTLIELLVVIAIIGLLSSIVLVSLSTARSKGMDAQRVANISAVRTALELYYGSHNGYPPSGSNWVSTCNAWTQATQNNAIPGLVSGGDMGQLPLDSQVNAVANTCCYLYISGNTSPGDGGTANYKYLFHNCPTSNLCYGSGEARGPFPDPVRPTWACAVWSSPVSQGW